MYVPSNGEELLGMPQEHHVLSLHNTYIDME